MSSAPQITPPRQARSAQRRAAIVETAWSLIASRGFDATSVNTIISELGISKGSFYHHFESKDAVLDALVETLTREVTDREANEHQSQPARERLCALIRSGWDWHEQHAAVSHEILVVMLRPENAELLHRLMHTEQRVFRPLLEDILQQGIDEDVFDAPSASMAAEMLTPLLSDALVRIARDALDGLIDIDGFIARVRYLQSAIERLLGVPAGELDAATPDPQGLAVALEFVQQFQATPAAGNDKRAARTNER